MHALPLAAQAFDHVLLLNVLTYASEPRLALSEAARVLAPGGVLLLVTLDAHEHTELTAAYGHIQPGFAPSALQAMLLEAGLHVRGCGVSSQERRSPRFRVVSAFADKTR
jgi:ArsR family transcriptional regulator